VVVAVVDLSDQALSLEVSGELLHVWPVSTGRSGYATPTGEWRAQWLSPYHRSSKYGWAPMPWSVFFHGGYAIHGTTEVDDLGQPASHGCIRLHPDNAKIFYDLVESYGTGATLIRIVE
jgi:lipoprotein-anchoring transpeptidase ErfK/SrfK